MSKLNEMIKVSIFGLGYVGLSYAVVYALKGIKVYGFDIDEEKIKLISRGFSPIREPGVSNNLKRLIESKSLIITDDHKHAILNTDITFICVNTPSFPNGEVDLRQINSAIEMIGSVLKFKSNYHLVVIKSTVPPMTTESIIKLLLEKSSGKAVGKSLGLCVMPEFLREGSSLKDILNPWRIVIGEIDKKSGDMLEKFVKNIYGDKLPPIIRTSPVNAELIKYTSNAFLAMRVSFINSIARICEILPNADVDIVAYGAGLDPRIGTEYLKAGPGYGGICLPKDLKALIRACEKYGYKPTLFKAIDKVNREEPQHIVNLLEMVLGNLRDKVVGILGLAFKPGTDDIRDSPAINIIKILLSRGAKIKVHDPLAMDNAKKILKNVIYAKDKYNCVKNSDAIIIVTDWSEYKELNCRDFLNLMKKPIVLDTRRILKDKCIRDKRIIYLPIGIFNPIISF